MAERNLSTRSSIEEGRTMAKSSKSQDKREISRVVSGKARIKKKTEGQKLARLFLPKDVTDIKHWLLADVIVPNLKSFTLDVLTKLLYPEGNPNRKRGPSSVIRGISYSSIFDEKNNTKRSNRSTSRDFDYDDVSFTSAADATAVIDAMSDAIDMYNSASVADLYEMAGVTANNPQLYNYGWTDIRGASVIPNRDGEYTIRLPMARPLD